MNKNKNIITAREFYKRIKEEENKYKLVNGLFIVKYINKDICVYISDFWKSGEVLNKTKTNLIKLSNNPEPQIFNIKNKTYLTFYKSGIWKKLNIGFKEQNIKEILN